MDNVYQFSFININNQPFSLAEFKKKVILIINTACECGFTPQYAELQKLHERYEKQGLIIIAAPSNDFGQQEPGDNVQIKKFTDEKYNITFLRTTKIHIKNENAHPFYQWAAQKVGVLGRPKWNFHKYLIGRNGELLDWFSSITSPTSERMIAAIETALAANPDLDLS